MTAHLHTILLICGACFALVACERLHGRGGSAILRSLSAALYITSSAALFGGALFLATIGA